MATFAYYQLSRSNGPEAVAYEILAKGKMTLEMPQ